MKIEIRKIELGELESFVNSEAFKQMKTIPISPERAKSYQANPSAKTNDIALYLAYVGDELIAFRSLFADVVHMGKKQIRFAWCSGNWVDPHYRRKGISERLLHEAYKDWDKKLMFTNYAPHSENLYLKTGLFKSIYQFNGARAYLFPKIKKLVPATQKSGWSKFASSIFDSCINIYARMRVKIFKERNGSGLEFKEIEHPDKQCFSMNPSGKELFDYDRNKLNWIFSFPWITDQQTGNTGKYPFSSYSSSFAYKTVKIFSSDTFLGFFIFSVREGHLKTLYWNLPKGIEKETTTFIRGFCMKNKIEFATVYKTPIAAELIKRKFPFLHVKKYGQKIYSTFELEDVGQIEFQDCTGDVIFT